MAFTWISHYIGAFTIQMSTLNPILDPGPQWGTSITLVPGLLFDFLVKVPLIASDAAIAYLLYVIMLRGSGDSKLALATLIGWFLNPLAIWVSSGWGMFDTLPTLFTVIAFYGAIRGKTTVSGVSLALSMALKYYSVVLVVPMGIIMWKEGGRRRLVLWSVALLATSLILFLPSFGEVVPGYLGLATRTAPQGLSYSGLSFWSAITLFSPFPAIAPLSSILIICALLACYYSWYRSKLRGVYWYATMLGVPVVILLTLYGYVGMNYFVWLIPFGSILATRSHRGKIFFWAMSLIAFFSSLVDSLPPYYMLPLAPWMSSFLVETLEFFNPYRVEPSESIVPGMALGKLVLGVFGVASAIVLALLVLDWLRNRNALGGFVDERPEVSERVRARVP